MRRAMMIADKVARDPVWAAGDDGAKAPSPLERLVRSEWYEAVERAQEVQGEAGGLIHQAGEGRR